MRKKLFGYLALTLILFLTDRVLKIWFLKNPGWRWDFIDGFLGFYFATNTGIAFGIPIARPLLFVIIFVVFIILIWLLKEFWQAQNQLAVLATILIIGGALANLIDRIRYGFVVDYIGVPFFSVFNLADAMISLGLALIIFDLLIGQKRKDQLR